MRCIKGAHASHRAQWARGQVPGAAALAAKKQYAVMRRLKVGLPASATSKQLRAEIERRERMGSEPARSTSGQTDMTGI
jgi:hypothetical protein